MHHSLHLQIPFLLFVVHFSPPIHTTRLPVYIHRTCDALRKSQVFLFFYFFRRSGDCVKGISPLVFQYKCVGAKSVRTQGRMQASVCVCVCSSGRSTKALCRGRSGKPQRLSHGDAHHRFGDQAGGEGCGTRSLRLCVGGAGVHGEEKDLQRDLPGVLTLHWMIAEGWQGNSSMQFVGSHNLTSSPKAGC